MKHKNAKTSPTPTLKKNIYYGKKY
jgi:hypothetical protein